MENGPLPATVIDGRLESAVANAQQHRDVTGVIVGYCKVGFAVVVEVAVSTKLGWSPSAVVMAVRNVPSPLPNSTGDTTVGKIVVRQSPLATATSSWPSALKSPTATEKGTDPAP